MFDPEGTRIRDRIAALFAQPIDAHVSDDVFNNLACSAFAYQFERNKPYRAYCDRRGRTPATVTHWSEIPPVPTAAYRHLQLIAGNVEDAEAVFRTSGTTAGRERRGTHFVLDVSLYEESLLAGFKPRLLPDNPEMPMLSLIPRASELGDSSLAHMVENVIAKLGAPGSEYFADISGGIDEIAVETRIREFSERGTPVCILGTSFSYVHWLDSMRQRGVKLSLPPGSRLMDTGGYKGRSREVAVEEMISLYEELLGIPPHACVNEYGMTELCSQMYDVGLGEYMLTGKVGERRKKSPPWVRTRIVDPVTLEPANGDAGLVQIFDLANLGSVIAVQTEDLGRIVDDGFVVLGRAPGAQPRGCSIAMDDLLSAARAAD